MDADSDQSIINKCFVEQNSKLRNLPIYRPDCLEISTPSGIKSIIEYKIIIPLLLRDKHNQLYTFDVPMQVCEDLDMLGLLGRDFINPHCVIIDSAHCRMDIPTQKRCYVHREVQIPPYSEVVFTAQIKTRSHSQSMLNDLQQREVLRSYCTKEIDSIKIWARNVACS